MDENEKEENHIMRANEVQKLLKIGKNTLYDLCRQKRIPHRRVGRIIIFVRKRVMEWAENPENEGGKEWDL